jgi:hypothetical protein
MGSAAVLVAVTGARAADAIVAEPEPVEYVRVCDAYGKGYFYIPGTETCIKFSGSVRVQYGFTHRHDQDYYQATTQAQVNGAAPLTPYELDQTSAHEANYTVQLRVDAKNETEYGTLGSFFRMEAESTEGGHDDVFSASEGPSAAGVVVNQAVISLGGFRMGYNDNFWSTNHGYGYYQARFSGPYGFGTGIFLDYTYSANGLALTVGVEDGNASGESGAPDLYAGFNYDAGSLSVAGTVYNDGSESAIAWKLSADYDFDNGFSLGGWYSSDGGETDYVKGHTYGIRTKYALTDTLLLFAGYGAYADQADDTNLIVNGKLFAPVDFNRSFTNWTVGVAWNPVPGLLIQPEYSSTDFDLNIPVAVGTATTPYQVDNSRFSLRIRRDF